MEREKIRELSCREAREMFSLLLDGCAAAAEADLLQQHLDSCRACRSELEVWQKISGALKGLRLEAGEPDKEFAGRVVAGIGRKEGGLAAVTARLKKIAAAAAAAGIIAAGALGLNAGLKVAWNRPDAGSGVKERLTVAQGESRAENEAADGSGAAPAPRESRGEGQNGGVVSNTGTREQKPAAGTSAEKDTGAGSGEKMGATSAVQPGPEASGGVKEPPVALLSGNLVVESTVLKLAVADIAAAGKQAAAAARSAGGGAQLLVEQAGAAGERVQILRLTVPADQSEEVISNLTGLGRVLDRQDERNDVTSQYRERLARYEELSALVGTAPEGERSRLEAELAATRQQLSSYVSDAGKHVIVLWLQES